MNIKISWKLVFPCSGWVRAPRKRANMQNVAYRP